MANSRYEYVKRFELADELLPEVWIVIRIDGRGFTKFSQAHEFEKPNDVRALCLMNASAKAVVEDQPDCIFAYGVSDEYSFVLRKSTSLYQRRASKLVSVFVSYFASNFVHRWPDFFPDKNLQYLPAFDGRAVCYPTAAILRDYLAWRQVDCHINNQYNACYWALVKSGATPAEAQATIKGTQADFKNELLFKRFGINYSTLPAIFRKGTSIYRKEVQKAPPAKKLRISGRGEKNTTASSPNNDSPPMTMEDKRNLSIALANMGPDLLRGIVEIIKERHAELISNDEELTLDIDVLDDATLWGLKRYVEEKVEGPRASEEAGPSVPPAQPCEENGERAQRRKRQLVVDHCDIIGPSFWKENPMLLGRDFQPRDERESNGSSPGTRTQDT